MERGGIAAALHSCDAAAAAGMAQPEKENAHVPVLGIVTTAAEDDRREAQSEALVHAAEEHGFKVLEMPVERTQEAQIEAVRALIVYQVERNRIYAAGGKRLGQRAARSKIRLCAAAVDRPRDTRRG